MQGIMGVTEFAKVYYSLGDGAPSKSQENCIRKMCANGTIRNAEKVGKRWFINCKEEWPLLFPEAEEPPAREPEPRREPVITADMRLGDAVALLLDMLAERSMA